MIIKTEIDFASFVSELMKNRDLTSTQTLVLIAIGNRMRLYEGRCVISSKELADAASVTPRTVKTTVSQLQELGYLKIEERFENGGHLANEYFLGKYS